ncbi:unnamed protein product [Soboliphyme baturini]|uniref:Protein kinase domain-containing protein n=1 Tax=Soboliphyme baturini TaxID=241478 RepID=A0A183IVD6_9BILA|nr:unnamed protein product [Soboliphyme baturini]
MDSKVSETKSINRMTVGEAFTSSGATLAPFTELMSNVDWPVSGDGISDRWKFVALVKSTSGNEAIRNYDGYDTKRNRVVCIRISRLSDKRQLLKTEAKILEKNVTVVAGSAHGLRLCDFGNWSCFQYLVFKQCGPSLHQLRRQMQSRSFTEETIVRVAVQCVEAIRDLHRIGYVHRNVRPMVFHIGSEPKSLRTIFLTDFDVAKRYLDKNGNHKPYKGRIGFRGSTFYASINSHEKKELSRRDDLWSLFYVIIEMFKGWLPWKQIYNRETALKLKQYYTPEKLCEALPPQFRKIVKHLRSLK